MDNGRQNFHRLESPQKRGDFSLFAEVNLCTMTIERTATEVIIRLSPSLDVEELQRLLNYLAYKEATADSSAVQEDVDVLAADVRKGRFQRSRARYNA